MGHCRNDSVASFALFRTCHEYEQQQISGDRTGWLHTGTEKQGKAKEEMIGRGR